jgi:galactonate dehydratase
VWPFDSFAPKAWGARISREDLDQGLDVIRAIRDIPGPKFDVALELHGLWRLPAATEIVRSAQELDLMWVEEVLSQDEIANYKEIAKIARVPIIISERLQTKYQFKSLLELGVADIIMFDIDWCGGLTEAQKISALADAYGLPVAPHNCGGPVLHALNAHLCTSIPNLFICETVRRWREVYAQISDGNPEVEGGVMRPTELPGHGVSLKPEFLRRPDLVRQGSRIG